MMTSFKCHELLPWSVGCRNRLFLRRLQHYKRYAEVDRELLGLNSYPHRAKDISPKQTWLRRHKINPTIHTIQYGVNIHSLLRLESQFHGEIQAKQVLPLSDLQCNQTPENTLVKRGQKSPFCMKTLWKTVMRFVQCTFHRLRLGYRDLRFGTQQHFTQPLIVISRKKLKLLKEKTNRTKLKEVTASGF